MNAAERRNLNARVATVLSEEVHGQFLDLYAAAVSLTEKHPEQVNNELRNALTHLSRAVSADSIAAAEAEVAKSLSHLERAKRDAVKVAVFELRNLIADACADIKLLNGHLEPGFAVRRNEVARKRKAIVQQEAQGAQVINAFVELYLEADALHDDLLQVLSDGGRRRARWQYRLLSFRQGAVGVVIGALIAFLGATAFAIYAPDPAAFGNGVRKWAHLPLIVVQEQPKASAASTPSTGGSPGAPGPKK